MARSLNKVQLIGNLTRDPEVRYTGKGTAVASFSIATNREWKEDGNKKEQVEFHRLVAWDKLAEICGKYLKKGSKIYVDGRLQSNKWTGKDGLERTTWEVVINEMMMLDSKGSTSSYDGPADDSQEYDVPDDFDSKKEEKPEKSSSAKATEGHGKKKDDSSDDDDIPF